jgi:hypothetical protein
VGGAHPTIPSTILVGQTAILNSKPAPTEKGSLRRGWDGNAAHQVSTAVILNLEFLLARLP